MGDLGPDMVVERRRLENQRRDILGNVAKSKIRLEQIEIEKQANLARVAAQNAELEETMRHNLDEAELRNLVLDSEANRIRENEVAAEESVAELDATLKTPSMKPGSKEA